MNIDTNNIQNKPQKEEEHTVKEEPNVIEAEVVENDDQSFI